MKVLNDSQTDIVDSRQWAFSSSNDSDWNQRLSGSVGQYFFSFIFFEFHAMLPLEELNLVPVSILSKLPFLGIAIDLLCGGISSALESAEKSKTMS